MDDSYNNIAHYYDLWCDSDPASEVCRLFYLRRCPLYDGPIVEVGVGTGRISLSLARLGLKVIGVDSSEKMLELCRQKIEGTGVCSNIELICGDFLDFVPISPVGQVILPFRTLGHFTSFEERRRLFLHVRSILKPGGIFMFDHFVVHKSNVVQTGLEEEIERLCRQTPQGEITLRHRHHLNYATQIIDSQLTIENVDRLGSSKAIDYKYKLAWVYHDEIESLAADFGFKVGACFGTFDENPFNDKSPEHIWVLQAR